MVGNMLQQFSKQKWYKWAFYVNIILFFVVVVSIYFLVIDSINAGMNLKGDPNKILNIALNIARDIGFLVAALALIFFQFFRNMMTIIRRSL